MIPAGTAGPEVTRVWSRPAPRVPRSRASPADPSQHVVIVEEGAERVQLAIEALDTAEREFSQLPRGHVAPVDQLGLAGHTRERHFFVEHAAILRRRRQAPPTILLGPGPGL